MEFYILFWICIIGLCLGSFFNVVILRSLSGESIVFPPSKCPKCQHKLFWWHNIPILSYIILRGKCYFCREKISIQYPIIEFLTMIIFAASYLKFGFSWKCLFVIFWLSCFLIMTMTDLREKVADCNIAIIAALSGILYNFLQTGGNGIISSVLGLIAGAIVLEAIARSGCLLVGTRAMGEADTYVAGALGAIFGLQNTGYVLLYALIASMIFIIPMFLYNRYRQGDKYTCILSILFILSALVYNKLYPNFWMAGILTLIGFMLAAAILKSIKTKENRNYLPYIPAFALGALYFIFFSVNF